MLCTEKRYKATKGTKRKGTKAPLCPSPLRSRNEIKRLYSPGRYSAAGRSVFTKLDTRQSEICTYIEFQRINSFRSS